MHHSCKQSKSWFTNKMQQSSSQTVSVQASVTSFRYLLMNFIRCLIAFPFLRKQMYKQMYKQMIQ